MYLDLIGFMPFPFYSYAIKPEQINIIQLNYIIIEQLVISNELQKDLFSNH